MQEDEFPWIAAILREDAETADQSECGGTLVSCLPIWLICIPNSVGNS